MKTKIILVGGFLGAGKTTLLGAISKRLKNKYKNIGFVTNDQASELVDTALLLREDGTTVEVSGSCFCCNFDGFADAVLYLRNQQNADIIIAEPVGSCTDLSATILQPLKDKYKEELSVAPLSVLIDPDRISDILDGTEKEMHSSAVYIVIKQMEEADYIVINKIDLLTGQKIKELKTKVETRFPKSKVIALSAQTGAGIEEWLMEVLNSTNAGIHLAEVDYDIYAEGEAVLGWLNASVELSGEGIDWKEIGKTYLMELCKYFDEEKLVVGHVKLMIEGNTEYVTGNLTGKEESIKIRGKEIKESKVRLTLNARVQMMPEQLEKVVCDKLAAICGEKIKNDRKVLNCLQPGRPDPTYHYSEIK